MQRFSKKRQAILDALRQDKSHPTAEMLYQRLKPAIPGLSLATVYRNLRQMEKQGLIRSVGTFSGQERFDGTTAPHTHAVCRLCGRTVDVSDLLLSDEELRRAQEITGFLFTDPSVTLTGLCEACKEKISGSAGSE